MFLIKSFQGNSLECGVEVVTTVKLVKNMCQASFIFINKHIMFQYANVFCYYKWKGRGQFKCFVFFGGASILSNVLLLYAYTSL